MECDLPRNFHPSSFLIKPAISAWERRDAFALRRRVFCAEQALFDDDDRDALDAEAILLCAVAQVAGMPDRVVGTVRIHQRMAGTWYGSRLAVERDCRRHAHLGAGLIELAVRTATTLGARVFLAHVQTPNLPLFLRMHWHSLEATLLHGRPHHFMRADLARYPALTRPQDGLLVLNRQVA